MASVHILGAGAIGLTFAHRLSSRHDITVITRTPQSKPWQFSEQQNTVNIISSTVSLAELSNLPTLIENCFVCVKAYQLKQAIEDILPFLADSANLFISHNGILDLSTLETQLKPSQALYFVSTSRGALKLNAYHVKATGNGDTFIGASNQQAQQRIPTIYHAFFETLLEPSFIHHDITLLRWQKLMVNIAINPLSALHQIPNGQLRQPRFAGSILALLNEACHVASHCGVPLNLADALHSAYQVMARTQSNFSSMAQDIKHGRKTEIEAICGYIVELGKQHGLATNENAKLLDAVKGKH